MVSARFPNLKRHQQRKRRRYWSNLSSYEKYVTPVGKWLRKTSLEELPQLWSVMKGDISKNSFEL
ncbi:MAG: sugar transferase [Deltaproteobacteria bacterium]|nr:sugar transferase [Deltaproteobacteria bacterium]